MTDTALASSLTSNAKPPAHRFNVASVVRFLSVPDCLITRLVPCRPPPKPEKCNECETRQLIE